MLRSYPLDQKQTIQVTIGEGVPIALADQVIPLIIAHKLRFDLNNDYFATDYRKKADKLKPQVISKADSENNYTVYFEVPTHTGLNFKLEKGQIIVTGFFEAWN